jgi:hypothetical protein
MEKDKKRDSVPIAAGPPSSFLEAKMALRREMIALPFEEKINRVIEMQKMARSLQREGAREIIVWKL